METTRRPTTQEYAGLTARPKDDEVALWVATLLEFLHEQEPGGPTVEDVQAQYMLMLDRVPRWRRTTIVDFLKRSLGVLRFFREATRVILTR